MNADQQSTEGLTIEDLWDEAEKEFQRVAGQSLKTRSKISSLKDALSHLDSKYGSGKSDSHAKTKRIASNVITIIQNLGGLAIQGASMVFGPAQLCFSAFSFLLEIPSKIDKVFGSIGTLCESLEHYLMKLDIYKRIEKSSGLPHSLLYSTNRILTKFVEICGLAYGLAFGSKMAKTRAALLAGFCDNDSGVSGALKQFSDLIEKQMDLESSLNLEHTIRIDKNTQQIPEIAAGVTDIRRVVVDGMETLVSDVRNRSSDKVAEESRNALMSCLDIPKEVIEEQKKIFDEMQKDCLSETAVELQKSAEYLNWADFASDAQPILFLSGQPHSGKSFLIQSIIGAVRSGGLNASQNILSVGRVVIAYHMFQKLDERTATTHTKFRGRIENPVEMAVKHICVQIAQQHKAYAKEITNLVKNFRKKTSTAQELWNDLSIGRPKGDTIHVIILDGLDQLETDDLDAFFHMITFHLQSSDGMRSAFPNRSKVRILVSGTPSSFPKKILIDVPILESVKLNVSNVVAFIKQELEIESFWKEDSTQIKSLKTYILEKLPARANGDFAIIKRALDAVKKTIDDGRGLGTAQQALIEACEQNPASIAPKIIEELLRSLNPQDIKRLNVLLTWLMWCSCRFSLDLLSVIAYLESRDDPFLSFKTIIRTKYAKILDFGDDDTDFCDVKDEIYYHLRNRTGLRRPDTLKKSSTEPTISMEIKINNAPLSEVKRFLWNLTERTNLNTSFFDGTDSTEPQVGDRAIQAYPLDSWIHIANKLLELLNDDFNETTERMLSLAYTKLPDLLSTLYSAAKDDELEPEELKTILVGIINLLSEPEMLDQHKLGEELVDYWLLDEQSQDDHFLYNWLSYSPAIEMLDRRDRRRLDKLMDQSQGPLSFFVPLTKVMAHRWLQSDKEPVYLGYLWIDSYLDVERSWQHSLEQNENPDLSKIATSDSIAPQATIDELPELSYKERFDRALNWARNNLPHLKQDAQYFRRIGGVYYDMNLDDEALEAYEAGKRVAPRDWQFFTGCALVYEGMGRYNHAIEQMLVGFGILRNQPGMDLKAEDGYLRNLYRLIRWLIIRARYAEAIEECRGGLLLSSTDDAQLHILLIEAMQNLGDMPQIQEYLTTTFATPTKAGQSTKLTDLLEKWTADTSPVGLTFYEVIKRVMRAAHKSGCEKVVLEAIRQLSRRKDVQDNVILYGLSRAIEAMALVFTRPNGDLSSFELGIEAAEDIMAHSGCVDRFREGEITMVRSFAIAHQVAVGCYVRRLLRSLELSQDNEETMEKLNGVIVQSRCADTTAYTFQYLAGYFIKIGQKEKARDLLRPSLEEYLDMLVDDTPENDPEAFFEVASVLAYFQDHYNSLTAWSLLAPFDADVGLGPEHLVSMSEVEKAALDIGRDIGEIVKTMKPSRDDMDLLLDEATSIKGGSAEETGLQQNIHSSSSSEPKMLQDSLISTNLEDLARTPPTQPRRDSTLSQKNPDNHQPHRHHSFEPNGTNDQSSSKDVDEGTTADIASPAVSIWLRVSRSYLSPTTLDSEGVPWIFDPEDEDYVIVQDHLNVKSLLSMRRHTKLVRSKTPSLRFECSEACGTVFDYASNFYMCKYCHGKRTVCSSCMSDIRAGKGEQHIYCAPDHEFLYIPPWSNRRYKEIGGKGKVRINGEIGEDGRITGGQVVEFQVWLNNLRKEWGLTELEAGYRWQKATEASKQARSLAKVTSNGTM